MNEKLDSMLTKMGSLFDKWLEEFEISPVRTTVKALLILYAIKWARRNLL
jgi:hypothetical protein